MKITFQDYIFLTESENKKACISFGRLNPITVGHIKMLEKLKQVASQSGAVPMLFMSHTQDKKKNPLSYEQKIKYAKSGAPSSVKVMSSPARTIYEVIPELAKLGYTDIIVVCGSDRVESFSNIEKYKDDMGVSSVKVVSAGERDSDSDDLATSMSASKLRQYAKDGDYDHFAQGAGCASNLKKQMYQDVQKGMGL